MTLPPDIIQRLQGEGVTTAWLQGYTLTSRQDCVRLLTSLGAKRNNCKWTLPSLARTESRDRRMANGHTGTFRDEVGQRRSRL